MFVGISVLLYAVVSILITSTEGLVPLSITSTSTRCANSLSYTPMNRFGSIRTSQAAKRMQPLHAITDFENVIKKWYFLTERDRPEMTTSQASTISAILGATWKSVLIGLRVLEDNFDMSQYTSVIALPNFKVENTPPDFESTVTEVMDCLSTSAALFQPDIIREVKTLKKPASDGNPELWVVSVKAYRAPGRSKDVKFDELDFDDFAPGDLAKPEVWNNSLDAFPFPSVFDFISEINRPCDPVTMANLRHTFQIKDFKTDLTKIKKKNKKNPQEIIDGINCKLTRLQNWRDVLVKQPTKMSNPFTDISTWQDEVKSKYSTLIGAIKEDPRKALETQYDKQQTFINIIDKWSDRLESNFKYFYQGQRRSWSAVNQEFSELIKQSQWRKSFVQLVRVFDDAPFLKFTELVPSFVPGAPEFVFRVEIDRLDMFSANYPLDVCAGEMLSWLSGLDKVQDYSCKISPSGTGRCLPIKCITQQSYSRGFVAERVMYDLWTALSTWEDGLVSAMGPSLQTVLTPADAPAKQAQPLKHVSHHDDFLRTMQQLNSFTREENLSGGHNVRDMYKEWSGISSEMTEWLTAVVADLNVDTELNRQIAVDNRRKAKLAMASASVKSGTSFSTEPAFDWGIAINQCVIDDMTSSETTNNVGGEIDTERNARLWSTYEPIVEKAKFISAVLDRSVGSSSSGTFSGTSSKTSSGTSSGTRSGTSTTRATKPVSAGNGSRSLTAVAEQGDEQEGLEGRIIRAARAFSYDMSTVLDGSDEEEDKAARAAGVYDFRDASGSESLFTHSLLPSSNSPGVTIGADALSSGEPFSMLFTLPRYYRGIGRVEDELNMFLDLCKAVLVQIKHLRVGGYSVNMVPLHPAMINQKGMPNFYRKSPHPALLFYLNKSK